MIEELATLLREDATLRTELAESVSDGLAAIYLEWAPQHPRPYVTVGYDESLDTEHVTSGTLQFDIWGDGVSYVELEPVRDRLFDLLDHVTLSVSRGTVRFFYDSDGPEATDDPSTVRWRVTYAFRRGRTEHVD